MTSQFKGNPLTMLLTKVAASGLLREGISAWFKMAKIAIVTVIGSVEDERTFLF
jgi:hypothetical protein